jgi:hypothetical protein
VAACHARRTAGVRHRRRCCLAGVIVCLLAIGRPALATEATAAEVADLAGRAADDAEALERLREIDVVDGREMDLATVLATDDETTLRARLETLSQLATPVSTQDLTAGEAAAAAAGILEDARYRAPPDTGDSETPPSVPGEPSGGGGFERLFDALGLLVFVLAIVAVVTLLARRHPGAAEARRDKLEPETKPEAADPGKLERLAAEAEREGRYEDAVRLRFSAGLLRLDAAGRIELEPWTTGRQVAAELSSQPFDRILTTFEPVAYGEQAAADEDAAAARRDWHRVLAERR